jgi:large subunit ribosomal protein L30
MSKKTIRLRQVRSEIGFDRGQRQTLLGLRLRRVGATSEIEDTPAVRGMINKVKHLLQVEEN